MPGKKFFNSQFGAQMVSFAVVTEPKDISRQPESSLRGFWSLFVTQFQGAFSDNVLKNLVVFLLVGWTCRSRGKHELGELGHGAVRAAVHSVFHGGWFPRGPSQQTDDDHRP